MTTETELPVLTGSEKQITWATKIRADLMTAMDSEAARYLGSIRGKTLSPEKKEQFLVRVANFKAKKCKNIEASWWIDHRYLGASDLVHLVK